MPDDRDTTLGTAVIFSTQMDALAAFYAQALALGPPDTSMDRHRGWDLGSCYFGVDQVDEPAGSPPSAVTLWFTVGDLDATFARCVALGARVRSEPADKPWGGRLAAVHDPEGNIVGLSQRR